MTKLVGTAALLALALFGVGCTESVEAEDDGEEVASSEEELRAKPLDFENLVATVRPSKEIQTVKARFSFPGSAGYVDTPAAFGCGWSPQRFDLKVQVKVTGNTIKVRNIRIGYETSIAPAALSVYDSSKSERFTFGSYEFGLAGNGGLRGPGHSDRMVVNKPYKAQTSNGEGANIELNFEDSNLDVKSNCGRTARLLFVVKK